MFKQKGSRESAVISTLLGTETRIEGDVEFTGGCLLEGQIRGNVRAGEGSTLSVREGAYIEGMVEVANILLDGTVRGDVVASHRVELGSNARVIGNVQYSLIEMAIGAEVNGKLIHRGESPHGEASAGQPRAIEPDRASEEPQDAIGGETVRVVEAS